MTMRPDIWILIRLSDHTFLARPPHNCAHRQCCTRCLGGGMQILRWQRTLLQNK